MNSKLIQLIQENKNISKTELKSYTAEEINWTDENGDTALHWALKLKNQDVASNLIDNKNTDIFIANNEASTPLIEAIKNDNDDLIPKLINLTIKARKFLWGDINKKDIMTWLIEKEKWKDAEDFFKKVPVKKCVKDRLGSQIIMTVIQKKQWDFVSLIMGQMSDDFFSDHCSCFYLLSLEQQWNLAERAVKKISVNPRHVSPLINTLREAVMHQKWNFANQIIDKFLPETKMSEVNTSDLIARLFDEMKWDLASKLITKITLKSINVKCFFMISYFCICNQKKDILEQLLNKINLKDMVKKNIFYKNAIFELALILQKEDLAIMLFDSHEPNFNDFQASEKYPILALHWAVIHNHTKIAERLLRNISPENMNLKRKNGDTFMHLALKIKAYNFIKTLRGVLKDKIDFTIKNDKDETIGSLLNDQFIEILKIGKINDYYFYFDFQNLEDQISTSSWNEILSWVKEIENIINEIKKIEKDENISDQLIKLPMNNETKNLIETTYLNNEKIPFQKEIKLYYDCLLKIIDLQAKAIAEARAKNTEKVIEEQKITKEEFNPQPSTSFETYNNNLSTFSYCKVNKKSTSKNKHCNTKKVNTNIRKVENQNLTKKDYKPKSKKQFNNEVQENYNEIFKSLVWIKKIELKAMKDAEERKRKLMEENRKDKIAENTLSTSNIETMKVIETESQINLNQKAVVIKNIDINFYAIYRNDDYDHDGGRPGIIIGKSKSDVKRVLVLTGTTQLLKDKVKMFELKLNESEEVTNFYNHDYYWIAETSIKSRWKTNKKLEEEQKLSIVKYLSQINLNQLAILFNSET